MRLQNELIQRTAPRFWYLEFLLMLARSLIMASSAESSSVTWRPSYSRPITGVMSAWVNFSSDPEYTSGSRHRVFASGLPPTILDPTALVEMVSAEGMLSEEL